MISCMSDGIYEMKRAYYDSTLCQSLKDDFADSRLDVSEILKTVQHMQKDQEGLDEVLF
jgi:hypothetical protein